MIEAFRFFLSATYAVSAISKLLHTSEANPLLNAIGIKLRYHPSIVFTLSVAELFVAGGLVWKRTATLAARSSSVLLVIFSGVTVVTLTRGYRGGCGCFRGPLQQRAGLMSLLRNLSFFTLSVAIERRN